MGAGPHPPQPRRIKARARPARIAQGAKATRPSTLTPLYRFIGPPRPGGDRRRPRPPWPKRNHTGPHQVRGPLLPGPPWPYRPGSRRAYTRCNTWPRPLGESKHAARLCIYTWVPFHFPRARGYIDIPPRPQNSTQGILGPLFGPFRPLLAQVAIVNQPLYRVRIPVNLFGIV